MEPLVWLQTYSLGVFHIQVFFIQKQKQKSKLPPAIQTDIRADKQYINVSDSVFLIHCPAQAEKETSLWTPLE